MRPPIKPNLSANGLKTYYLRMNLSERIVAGALPVWPYVASCALNPEFPCKRPGSLGIDIDIFRIILGEILGFNNLCIIHSSGNISLKFQIRFGTKAPLLQSLAAHDIDATAVLINIDDARELEMMDFSLPLDADAQGMVFQSGVNPIQKRGTIDPFSAVVGTLGTTVLYSLFLSCICIKFIMELSMHFGCKSSRKMTVFLVCFAAFFIFRFFKCKLYSDSVVRSFPRSRFENIGHLAASMTREEVRLATTEDYAYYYNWKGAKGRKYLDPLRQVIIDNPGRLELFPDFYAILKEAARNPKLVTIISESYYKQVVIHELGLCELEFVPIFPGTLYAFAFPKGRKLVKLVNWALCNRFYSVNDFYTSWENV